jgi:F-type H+-transporting ATPase subunit b
VSITGTLIVQMIVFLILVGFTMKFVWPPIAKALDERARRSPKAWLPPTRPSPNWPPPTSAWRAELGQGAQRVRQRCWPTPSVAPRPSSKRPRPARPKKATRSLPPPAPKPTSRHVKAREALREQVAALAVKGAEQILRKEVNAGVHADLLARLQTEL